ncbi:MAG: alanine--tRNA ligase [Ruminococcus sp.]|jgi:alanyl-tRNA synthetase|nr:alanine--tRNA ligase [Ruminococcus sp.]
MKWTGLNELRESFLKFFESKGHTRLESAPLIPRNDNSLLLINSGMAPLKRYFLGEETPPNVRVTTCQKCIRTPDIERVGKTDRHGTYFEMLGNFSFGDYFKNEAIAWAWEYFTKTLEMPADRLHISVYQDDDEAYDIWTKTIGIDPSHMIRLGKEDNFWEHGEGPCGPCSEIYFDRGEKYGCGKPDCKVGCDCDRFVEVWNLVFSQFDSDGKGTYTPMDTKNIDTGMGLERLACVMQDVGNLFEVDTIQNIMKHVCKIAGVEYKNNPKTDISLRVITDHIRSTSFMVGDGVLPSNEGRGYVLRRLLRRAARHGKLIGITKPFLAEVVETVINENKNAYPELLEKAVYIKKIISVEEEKFNETINRGLELLNEVMARGNVSGEDAFKLSDTFGFPVDLTIEIAEEKGLTVDEKRFRELAQIQRDTARADHFAKANSSWESGELKLDLPATEFVGYDVFECEAKVLFIDEKNIILDKTPFYAESGGQVADTGYLVGNGFSIYISGVKKTSDGLYIHEYEKAENHPVVGDIISARVDKNRRHDTMRNHTSAHLLQYALRQSLGEHVHQAGQLVSPDECRFDFTHFQALTKDELCNIENEINLWIARAIEVKTREMPIAEAKELGAMALFSEKYGDTVRVVTSEADDGNESTPLKTMELCGGTHVKNTAEIMGFKILSENSVAAGVRRITAITGSTLREYNEKALIELREIALILQEKNIFETKNALTKLLEKAKANEEIIKNIEHEKASGKVDDLIKTAENKDGIRLVSALLEGVDFESLKAIGDKLKSYSDIVGLLSNGEKFFCVCGKDAIAKGYKAGDIVKTAAAVTGGKGGGKPDSASAGVGDKTKINEALKGLI